MPAWWRSLFGPQEPSGPSVTIRRFEPGGDTPISSDSIPVPGDGWMIDAPEQRVIRLFEIPDLHLDNCMLTYRAMMRSEDLEGQAFLEMWVRLPGRGEFFSRGLDQPVTGTTSWASYETPFHLKKGQEADLVKLNLAIEGPGRVLIKDIELLVTPL